MNNEYVYLLSITAGMWITDDNVWLCFDESGGVLVPTSKMGHAMSFDTEVEAREYRDLQKMSTIYDVSPTTKTEFFKAKLTDGTR